MREKEGRVGSGGATLLFLLSLDAAVLVACSLWFTGHALAAAVTTIFFVVLLAVADLILFFPVRAYFQSREGGIEFEMWPEGTWYAVYFRHRGEEGTTKQPGYSTRRRYIHPLEDGWTLEIAYHPPG